MHRHTHKNTHTLLVGHKKQRGPKTTGISETRGDSDFISTPRSLTGSNSISPRCSSVLPRTITTTSTWKMIRQKRISILHWWFTGEYSANLCFCFFEVYSAHCCKKNVLFCIRVFFLQLEKAAKQTQNVFLTTTTCFSLTSQPFLDTVVRCETISLPESPRKWIILLAELAVPAVLEWFAVQLTVMCWKDVWLCNRKNLSWTTSTPAYPNYQRQK